MRAGEAWDEHPREWVQGTGCDAWILRLLSDEDPLDYAVGWNRHLRSRSPAEFEHVVERWSTWFDEEGIKRIVSGLVTLRRRSGNAWTRSDETAGQKSSMRP